MCNLLKAPDTILALHQPSFADLRKLSPEAKEHLEEPDLSDLDITDLDLAGFTRLKKLNLAFCRGFTVEILNDLPNEVKERIEELNLRGLNITGLDLTQFPGLKPGQPER